MHSGYYLWPHHLYLRNHAEYLSLCMLCHVWDCNELVLGGTFAVGHDFSCQGASSNTCLTCSLQDAGPCWVALKQCNMSSNTGISTFEANPSASIHKKLADHVSYNRLHHIRGVITHLFRHARFPRGGMEELFGGFAATGGFFWCRYPVPLEAHSFQASHRSQSQDDMACTLRI
jgi:hypothetical protein